MQIAMPHNEQNFSVHGGTDETLTLELPDEVLTGSQIIWRMFSHPSSNETLLEKDSAGGGEIETGSPATDEATVHLDAADTADLNPGVYFHGSLWIDGDGNERALSHGTIEIAPGFNPASSP